MNKKTRRYLKRLAERKSLEDIDCLKSFYGSSLNKNLIYSFEKKRNKGRVRIQEKNNKKIQKRKKRILEIIKKNVQ